MKLGHFYWVRGWTVKIKTFIVFISITIGTISYMTSILRFNVLTVPTGWELYVYFKFWNMCQLFIREPEKLDNTTIFIDK